MHMLAPVIISSMLLVIKGSTLLLATLFGVSIGSDLRVPAIDISLLQPLEGPNPGPLGKLQTPRIRITGEGGDEKDISPSDIKNKSPGDEKDGSSVNKEDGTSDYEKYILSGDEEDGFSDEEGGRSSDDSKNSSDEDLTGRWVLTPGRTVREVLKIINPPIEGEASDPLADIDPPVDDASTSN